MLEGLEARRLLAAALESGGLLHITGTTGNDTIGVVKSGTNYVATLNSVVKSFAASAVTSIFVESKEGNDRIVIDDSVTVKTSLRGGLGDDYLRGGGADSILKGEEGNDTMRGGLKSDLIQGGPGIDTADYSDRSDNLTITLGTDWNDGAAGENDNVYHEVEIVLGGSGNDYIKATSGSQTLYGNGGNDRLYGEGGKNVLYGGSGNDTMVCGSGDDEFFGGEGIDCASYARSPQAVTVTVNDIADDGMLGHSSNVHTDVEQVSGSAFNDKITVFGSQSRTLRGGAGGDSLFGAFGDDLIDGGDGDDLINGGEGSNELLGGLGVDTLFGGGGADTIVGGPDSDAAPAAGASTLASVTAAATALLVVPDADFISGGEGDDQIAGGMDNDTIIGSLGADNISGGSGNDFITGEEQNDTINGDDGNDTIGSGDGDDLIDGGLGIDSILGGDGADNITDDGSANPEELPAFAFGGGGNDTMKATGAFQQILIGDDGDDAIDGGDGDDILDGAAGSDTIFGHPGNDTIAGGYGTDDMHGNQGNDIFINNDGESDTMHGGDDIDLLQVEESSLDEFTFTEGFFDGPGFPEPEAPVAPPDGQGILVVPLFEQAPAGDGLGSRPVQVGNQLQVWGETSSTGSALGDNISITQSGGTIFVEQNGSAPIGFTNITNIYVDTGSGNDNIALQLFSGGNPVLVPATILAGNGNDTVVGGAGNDRISGGNDADNLTGAGGNDYIRGDAGNDTLDGSAGDDVLNGGNNDLTEADGADVISGGSGSADYADYSGRTTNLVLTLDGVANDNGDFIAASIEGLMGGKGNDLLIGNEGANFLSGAGGQDTLKGHGGNDNIVASVTTDVGFFDFVYGNAGYDYLFIEDKIKDNFNAVSGQDQWRTDIDSATGKALDVLVADSL